MCFVHEKEEKHDWISIHWVSLRPSEIYITKHYFETNERKTTNVRHESYRNHSTFDYLKLCLIRVSVLLYLWTNEFFFWFDLHFGQKWDFFFLFKLWLCNIPGMNWIQESVCLELAIEFKNSMHSVEICLLIWMILCWISQVFCCCFCCWCMVNEAAQQCTRGQR